MTFTTDSDRIFFCTNCDSEYTVTKIDDDDIEAEFCPFCGFDMGDGEFDDEEEDEDIDDRF